MGPLHRSTHTCWPWRETPRQRTGARNSLRACGHPPPTHTHTRAYTHTRTEGSGEVVLDRNTGLVVHLCPAILCCKTLSKHRYSISTDCARHLASFHIGGWGHHKEGPHVKQLKRCRGYSLPHDGLLSGGLHHRELPPSGRLQGFFPWSVPLSPNAGAVVVAALRKP